MGEIIGGRYQVGELLGTGGMGAVYHGIDKHSGEPVALKLLKPELIAPDMLARFAREGEALRQLNHPNIVKVLGAVQEADNHYIVMELVGAGSLADLMTAVGEHTGSSLPINRTLKIALELADALTRAHHLNIIHRDIKPANVLIADDGTPRLTDFGIAFMGERERITKTDSIVGTLDYLSPEAFSGGGIDSRSDIWAFGVMLFEMITGQRPFDRPTTSETLMAILNEPPPDLESLRPDAPISLIDLIYRMLEKDRSQRIPSVRLIGAELEAILQGRDSTPANVQISPLSTKWGGDLGEGMFATPTPPTDAPKHNLPAQTTPFVGREDELAELTKLLSDNNTRLVTILAPGGMGKTRLALEVAEAMLEAVGTIHGTSLHNRLFANGIYFIPLAPLTSPDFIVSTIAESVGFQFYQGGEPKQQLLDYFREKSMLLVMDNFEHVLSGAGIVSEILQAAPNVKILATSRERLNLSGETLFSLSGVDFPDWETPEDALNYSAVKLFMQSARRVRPDFELVADDLTYVARICRMVQGLPLGIVLAAAWVEMLSLREIVGEIAQSLDFLETELRDVPERHRSIRAVFDYSWNLLTDDERAVFAKLSVFRGGFTREAAQAIANASLRNLTALVNKSLLRRNPDTGRYEIHELLRQYAEARLQSFPDDEENIRALHSSYYTEYLSQQYLPLFGKNQKSVSEALETDIENIRAAWSWAVEHENLADIAKSIPTLGTIYELFARQQEGITVFKHAYETLSRKGVVEDDLLLLRLRLCYGLMSGRLGNYMLLEEIAQKSLPIFRQHDSQRDMLINLNGLSFAAMMRGDHATGKSYAEEAAELLGDTEDPEWTTITLANLSYVAFLTGDYETAIRMNEDSIRRTDALGNPNDRAWARNGLGETLHTLYKSEEAKPLFEESLVLFREIGNRRGMAFVLTNLGNVAHRLLRYEEAMRRYEEALAIHREIGDRRGIADTLNMLGGCLWSLGKYARAKTNHEEALRLFREMGDVRGIGNSLLMLGVACTAVGEYTQTKIYVEEALQLRRASGNIFEIADVLGHLARVEERLGNYAASLEINDQIPALRDENGNFPPLLYGGHLGNKASVYYQMGEYEKALEINEAQIEPVERSGFKVARIFNWLGIGRASAHQGKLTEAEAALRRSLQVAVEAGGIPWMFVTIMEAAYLVGRQGNQVRAVNLLSFVRSSNLSLHETRVEADDYLAELKANLSPDEYNAAYERGKSLELESVVRQLLVAAEQ